MDIAVVDSGGANITSMIHALKRLGVEPVFTSDKETIRSADRVILPGVGAAQVAMHKLRKHGLDELIPELQQPVLGVCLGMQLLFESSEEGDTDMLGIIPGRVVRFHESASCRVPHMGWNKIDFNSNNHFFKDLELQWFYFVHSYFAQAGRHTIATAEHGITFSAIVRRGNFYGTQFHPERSARAGSELLQRFLAGVN